MHAYNQHKVNTYSYTRVHEYIHTHDYIRTHMHTHTIFDMNTMCAHEYAHVLTREVSVASIKPAVNTLTQRRINTTCAHTYTGWDMRSKWCTHPASNAGRFCDSRDAYTHVRDNYQQRYHVSSMAMSATKCPKNISPLLLYVSYKRSVKISHCNNANFLLITDIHE